MPKSAKILSKFKLRQNGIFNQINLNSTVFNIRLYKRATLFYYCYHHIVKFINKFGLNSNFTHSSVILSAKTPTDIGHPLN